MVLLRVGNRGHLHSENMCSALKNYKPRFKSVYSAAAFKISQMTFALTL